MVDFLAENNSCGKMILNLVSCGNAILADMMRLSRFVPAVFTEKIPQELSKYSDLVFDFSYFKNVEHYENIIQNQPGLEELDEEFKENYIELLNQFYLLFHSIHHYITDLNRYVEELNEGIYIQQTVESVLQNEDGKQLLIEGVYLYGVMMMMLDGEIEADVRERMLVSYYRYSTSQSSADSSVDEVCKLMRGGGGVNKKPLGCPEEYLRRIPIDQSLVSMILGRLRSDDLYNQLSIFPHPDHRSTALATQASPLFVLLHLTPSILHNHHSIMREIVDKFFSDNWVISVYMGRVVNLIDAWAPYKAASQALNNTIDNNNVKAITAKHKEKLTELLKKLRLLLKEGTLVDEYVMQHSNKLIDVVRECNVTLRWLLLHTTVDVVVESSNKRVRQTREVVAGELGVVGDGALFTFLLLTSELELTLKEVFKKLLSERGMMWEGEKREGGEIMRELAEAFKGDRPLTRLPKNEKLHKWFMEMSARMDKLEMDGGMLTGGRIVKLIQALDEVQEFHQVHNVQVKQFIDDTKNCLHKMIKILNIKEDNLINLQVISDLSYAWNIIDNLTPHMQNGIKKDAYLVIKLRATILKLASALDLPLLRINQSNSSDLVSVSQYYSGQLVTYVRKVLQIIPETMFVLLSQIIDLLTNNIKEVPTRLDKDKMREYAQLDDRYKVAQLTQSISIFTEGMLKMKSTLVGIIKIDPKRLLEDGVRKELVRRVAVSIDKTLVFKEKKGSNLMQKLDELGKVMDGYRRSFEYIQDYVNIYGLKVWQEEYSRIINYNVEQECNLYVRNKIQDWQSIHQSQTIPIPTFLPIDSSVNFIGRLIKEILRITNPQTSVYLEAMATWYDYKSKEEVVTMKLFEKLEKAIGTWGLAGLDHLLCFMISQSLNSFIAHVSKHVMGDKQLMEGVTKLCNDLKLDKYDEANQSVWDETMISAQPQRLLQPHITRLNKHVPKCLEFLLRIGQMQMIRRLLRHQLSSSCTFQSKFLHSALYNFNHCLLSELEQQGPQQASADLLADLANCLQAAGLNDPLEKVYINTSSMSSSSSKDHHHHHFLIICVIITISTMPKMTYSKKIDDIMATRASECIDGTSLVVGMVTIMRQYPREVLHHYIGLLSAYIKSSVHPSLSSPKDRPPEIATLASFITSFHHFEPANNKMSLDSHLPTYLLNQLKLHKS